MNTKHETSVGSRVAPPSPPPSARPARLTWIVLAALLLSFTAAAHADDPAWLGASIQTLGPEDAGHEARQGVLITAVVDGGPADEAGLRGNDLIVAAESLPIAKSADLLAVLELLRPGSSLRLRFVRRGFEYSAVSHLDRRPEDPKRLRIKQPWPGLSVSEVPGQLREFWGGSEEAGVLVTTVSPGGPADVAGLWPGDLILAVEGRDVAGEETFRRYLQRGGVGNVVEIAISRQGTQFLVDFELRDVAAF